MENTSSRRDLLKKAAVGGGIAALAWTAPQVANVAGAGVATGTDAVDCTPPGAGCIEAGGGGWLDWDGVGGGCYGLYANEGNCQDGDGAEGFYEAYYQADDPGCGASEYPDFTTPGCSWWLCSCDDD